jgi:steroid delta-isomerase-like uncharacterized protein
VRQGEILEKNKAVVRRYIDEVINGRNLRVAEELIAPGWVDHFAGEGSEPGLGGFKRAFLAFREAFPDVRFALDDIVAEGDKVVYRGTASGTHKGPFLGIPATGRSFSAAEVHIVRVVDGKIVERWGLFDIASMLQQLGAWMLEG